MKKSKKSILSMILIFTMLLCQISIGSSFADEMEDVQMQNGEQSVNEAVYENQGVGETVYGDDLEESQILFNMNLLASMPDQYSFDISEGDIRIEKGMGSKIKVIYGPSNTTEEFDPTQMITITGIRNQNTITVQEDVYANITLDKVDINVSEKSKTCAFLLKEGSKVNLTLKNENVLKSGERRAGLQVPYGAELTIKGDGKLKSLGGDGGAAGIGGGNNLDGENKYNSSQGNITIESGTIEAKGGLRGGPGIGVGNRQDERDRTDIASIGNIFIKGGTITAYGKGGGAGIGGGAWSTNGHIYIYDGNIYAVGDLNSSGIGAGHATNMTGNIKITSGVITANGNGSGTGIGSGNNGGGNGKVYITAGNITAQYNPNPVNEVLERVYKSTITVGTGDNICKNQKVTCCIDRGGYFYTTTDVDGNIYIYLPKGKQAVMIRNGENKYFAELTVEEHHNNKTIAELNNSSCTCSNDIKITSKLDNSTVTINKFIGKDTIPLTPEFHKHPECKYPVHEIEDLKFSLPEGYEKSKAEIDENNNLIVYYQNGESPIDIKMSGTINGKAYEGDIQLNVKRDDNTIGLNINNGSITIIKNDAANNKITFHDGEKENTITAPIESPIMIMGNEETNHTINVEGSVTANITMKNVHIKGNTYDACAFYINEKANVNLTLNGENTLTSGINQAGLGVHKNATLTIDGSGSLIAQGGFFGAGIGGGKSSDGFGGTVIINGGTVTATGAEGIGGGLGTSGRPSSGGAVTINGGTVTAIGQRGCGIGAGGVDSCPLAPVTINGGTVIATGTDEAGIGGGNRRLEEPVTINGGEITATGGNNGAGIGGRVGDSGGKVIITGGMVTATGGRDTITGGGSGSAAGIGGGTGGAGGATYISGGSVKASSIQTQPVMSSSDLTPVYFTKITLLSKEPKAEIIHYIVDGGKTIKTSVGTDRKLYLYLPKGERKLVITTENGETYTLTVNVNEEGTLEEAVKKNNLLKISCLNKRYDGKPIDEPTVIENTSGGRITFTYEGRDGTKYDKTHVAPINIGKYTVTAISAETEYYKEGSIRVNFEITQATNSGGGGSHRDNTPKKDENTNTTIDQETENIDSSIEFTDTKNHWAKDAIDFVVKKGLFTGTGDGKFSPDTSMTRGMFVTVIGKLANINPEDFEDSHFNDVNEDVYYAPYVEWAANNGIVGGIGNEQFAPNKPITREEMAVMMYNFCKATGVDLKDTNTNPITFTDESEISLWARESVKAMQSAGILSGKDGDVFDPKGIATRAEVAAMLKKFILSVGDNSIKE